MSAVLRTTAVLSGMGIVAAAGAFTLRNSNEDFSRGALNASEHSVTVPLKEKLPSNFFQFTFGQYKWSNARA